MNKLIRLHIIWEYWIILIFMLLSIGLSILYMINPVIQLMFSAFTIHDNTLFIIAAFIWIRILKKKLKQEA